MPEANFIIEPSGKNTAPAIAVAAIHALELADDPVLLVLSADHEITDEKAFCDAVRQAQPLAEAGKLVTFGIVPTNAATGYGYIKRGCTEGNGFIVDQFVEKLQNPDASDEPASEFALEEEFVGV